MTWDPKLYLAFRDQRLRPALDLNARVTLDSPQGIVDLGCGPGNVPAVLETRRPEAQITGLDNAPRMLARARTIVLVLPGVAPVPSRSSLAHWMKQ